jgi:hypothetical protein
MSSIPVDVFRTILEHVEEFADLVALCQVNRICCSCSQDVLYRDISAIGDRIRVIQTLAHSTDLARRVRSFHTDQLYPELCSALQNLSSLRRLWLTSDGDASIPDGCTFKLDSFITDFPYDESLRNFLNNQPSLTEIGLFTTFELSSESSPFEETCLPNLTQVMANPSWLPILIRGRPVREVTINESIDFVDFDINFFTLTTAPIQKLGIPYTYLYPKSETLLACVFPSLVLLSVNIDIRNRSVRTTSFI